MLAPEQNALPLGLRPWPVVARFALIAILGLALQGCALITFGPIVSVRHLSDNPIDQALQTYDEAEFPNVARMGLLKRLPPGTPTGEVRRYLESIGTKCPNAPAPEEPWICHYSQYVISGFRSGLIVEYGQWRQYDFAIRLLPGRGQMRDLGICMTITTFDVEGSNRRGKKDEFAPGTICIR
jgi:hypothetical protein